MRVLMLGWEFPPHISGGLGTACLGITQGLAHHDVEVLFVVPHEHGDEDRRFARILGCNHVDGDPVPIECGARTQPSSARSFEVLALESPLQPYSSARGYGEERRRRGLRDAAHGGYGHDLFAEVRRYAHAATKLAQERSFDLIHAHDWMTYPAGLLVKERTGRPLVCHVHACEHDRAAGHEDPRIHAIEQLGFDGADHIVCVSHFMARNLLQRYQVDAKKLSVAHNAPARSEGDTLRTNTRDERPLVLSLGRITSQKGPGTFLDAAALVVRQEPKVRFVMCGDGDMLPAMVERAALLGLARNVHFTGFLHNKDVQRMYSRADLFVLPSVSEPFGLTPFEALSCGVPVLVSRQSGVAEILRSSPKFDHWDVEGLGHKILELIRQPDLRRELVRAGRADMRQVCWERNAETLLGIYGELVG